MKKISIGVPCYNEEENIELMYNAITEQMMKLDNYDYEIIFADNDSIDDSQQILREIANKDKHVKVIINQSNYGPARSSINCFRNASGDAYIGIPCDFQDPPEMIPMFIQEWEQGYDVAWGQKIRSEENKVKFLCRQLFYSIIKSFSDYSQIEQVDGFGIMDRKVIDTIINLQCQDPEYNTRNVICEYGFTIKLIPYTQQERKRGKSSYSIKSYFHFAVNSLITTSTKPLFLMTVMGLSMSVVCLFISLYYFIYKLANWKSFDVGIAPVLIGLFFVAGIQLFCMGVLGMYIAVIIRRVTNKPLVIEREKINFENI